MILAMNTIGGQVVVKLLEDGRVLYALSRKHAKDGRVVTRAIEKVLQGAGKSLMDVSGICVVCTGGSFSELRAGVTVANALGYALSIPVKGIDEASFSEPIEFSHRGKSFVPVIPQYSREPNIG